MGPLPLANAGRILLVAEIILVLRSGQPGFLVLLVASLAALRLQTEALARSTAVVGNEIFFAVETLEPGLVSFHRVPKIRENSLGKMGWGTEENPRQRKYRAAKKEVKSSANRSKKTD
jgi:hypothetical protein